MLEVKGKASETFLLRLELLLYLLLVGLHFGIKKGLKKRIREGLNYRIKAGLNLKD